MARMVQTALPPMEVRRSDNPESPVLTDHRKAENTVGRAIQRAQQRRGWSLKEFSDLAGRNERQLARWMDGSEHPQLDTLFAIVSFRQPLLIALAEIAGVGVDVQTVVTMRLVA